jgi:hypothetical protein
MGAISEIVAVIIAIPALIITSGDGLTGVTWALTIAYGTSLAIMACLSALELRAERSVRRWAAATSKGELLFQREGDQPFPRGQPL